MMNYSLIPSLEYITCIKIASIFWNQDDIQYLIAHVICKSLPIVKCKNKQRIRDRVIEKLSWLSLPESLEKKLLEFVTPMYVELTNWWLYHKNYFPIPYVGKSLGRLCWTQKGTVDRKATAEVLVKDKNTHITIRYKLACVYCLQDDIPLLWDEMPERLRKINYKKKYLMDPTNSDHENFEIIWAYELKGKLDKLTPHLTKPCYRQISPYRYGFNMAVYSSNQVAAEYFLQRLTPDEIKRSFALFITNRDEMYSDSWTVQDCIPREYFADLLCFLLSRMTEEQQKEVFKTHAYEILVYFLDWPLQNLFMRLANYVWTFLSAGDFCNLLYEQFTHLYPYEITFLNRQKTSREFWQQGPNSYKELVMENSMLTCDELLSLFYVGDKHIDSSIKEDIFSCNCGMTICKMLVCKNEWDLLDWFIDKCVTPKRIGNKTLIKHVCHLKKIPKRRENMCNMSFKNPLNQKDTKLKSVNKASVSGGHLGFLSPQKVALQRFLGLIKPYCDWSF